MSAVGVERVAIAAALGPAAQGAKTVRGVQSACVDCCTIMIGWLNQTSASWREHLLEQGRGEPRLRRRVLRDRPAHVLGAEDLSEDVVATAHVRRLRRQHVVEQAAAAELPEEAAEPFKARGL